MEGHCCNSRDLYFIRGKAFKLFWQWPNPMWYLKQIAKARIQLKQLAKVKWTLSHAEESEKSGVLVAVTHLSVHWSLCPGLLSKYDVYWAVPCSPWQPCRRLGSEKHGDVTGSFPGTATAARVLALVSQPWVVGSHQAFGTLLANGMRIRGA